MTGIFTVFTLFLAAFVLGLVFNAAPGAIFAETIRHAVKGGFKPALAVQIGSLVGDATWAVLGLVGVGLLFQVEILRLPIGIAGFVYLLWLAYDAWRASAAEFSTQGPGRAENKKALKAGVTLSLTNPQNIAYWAALGSAMGSVGIKEPQPEHYAVFFSGFMVASVVWSFFCAAVIARLFRNASTGWSKLTYRLCAIAFFTLALASLREMMHAPKMKTPAALEAPAHLP
jgi:chemosensory pili system protein ChpE/L-lysine exporter family protein LysE/ArgO